MKKLLSFLLAFVLAVGIFPSLSPAKAADPAYTSEGFGHYGMRFWYGASPIEPQATIYRMVLDALENEPAAPKVELVWEATPLYYSSYYRDEALRALRLDHPELDLAAYSITKWTTRLVVSYVSELSLTLERNASRPASYSQNLQAAIDRVNAASTDYGRAHAAFSWLLENCSPGGSDRPEQVFGEKKGSPVAFASAFQQLMDRAGVECVPGWNCTYNRQWDYVNIEGRWYVVDFVRALPLRNNGDTSYAYRYFLCGDTDYTSGELADYFMKYVGRGSQLSPLPETSPCQPAGETVTVTLADAANGRMEASLLSGAAVASGDRIPAGSTLRVTLVPDAGYDKQVHPIPSAAYDPAVGGAFTWTLPNIQHDVVLDGYFHNVEPKTRGTFTYCDPASGGTITAYDAWNQYIYEEKLPMGLYNVSEIHILFHPDKGFRLNRVQFKTWGHNGQPDALVSELSGSSLPPDNELVMSGEEITPYSYVTAEFVEDTVPPTVTVAYSAENGDLYAAEAATGNMLESGGALPLGGGLELTLLPKDGYEFGSLTVNGQPVSQKPDASGKLTLPNIRQNTVLAAVFQPVSEKPVPPTPPMPPSGGGDISPEPAPEPEVTVEPDGSAQIALPEEGVFETVRVPVSHWTPGTTAVLVYLDGTEKLLKKAVGLDGRVNVTLDRSARVVFRDRTPSFTDVPGHWAEAPIAFASSHELFQGTGNGTFSPEESMTRAMLATVLYRLEDSPHTSAGVTFPDVDNSSYYSEAAAWANKTGIVLGSGGSFLPGRNITRQELAAMVYRYAEAFGMDTAKRASLTGFTDSGNCAPWARDALSWAVSAGLLHGRENSMLAPGGTATRAEVAAILQRLLEFAAA